MTLAEIMRAIESKKRVKKIESQEKALFDYLLADLIYRSMARIYDNNVSYPAIEEAYPAFFDAKAIEKKKQEKKDELSAARFMQFVSAHNSKFKNKG